MKKKTISEAIDKRNLYAAKVILKHIKDGVFNKIHLEPSTWHITHNKTAACIAQQLYAKKLGLA